MTKLTQKLRNYAISSGAPNIFVSIDQEGGRVARLKKPADESKIPEDEKQQDFPVFESAEDMGKKSAEEVFKESKRMAGMLKDYGFNLNFAPLADVNTNPNNPVIGKINRSYSANPQVVATMDEAFIKGHREMNVATSLKHFPGHGSSTADSHAGFVDVSKTWKDTELIPYRELIRGNAADAIMTAHVINNALWTPERKDDTGLPKEFKMKNGTMIAYPATMSRFVITNVLRNELGFDGVVISDDLQMGALKSIWTYEQVLERVLLAGVDIFLNCLNTKYMVSDRNFVAHTINVLKHLVEERKDLKKYNLRQQVENSYKRIMHLKASRGIISGFNEVQCKK